MARILLCFPGYWTIAKAHYVGTFDALIGQIVTDGYGISSDSNIFIFVVTLFMKYLFKEIKHVKRKQRNINAEKRFNIDTFLIIVFQVFSTEFFRIVPVYEDNRRGKYSKNRVVDTMVIPTL